MTGTAEHVLLVERDGPVVTVTLNRPEQLNAFDDALHHAFSHFWIDLELDQEVRAVVLTGAGRAFSAGGNIEDFAQLRTDMARRAVLMRGARRIVDEMINVHVPVVAAVNGAAMGLGCTLATLCDVVFLSTSARMGDPHVAVALVAGDGSAVTWPQMMGLLKAKQYLLTGDAIPADEALAIGLATFVVPPDRLLDEAQAFARRLAALPPQAVQDTKRVLNQHLRASATMALGIGLSAETHSHDTAEYAAVPEQFASRRKG